MTQAPLSKFLQVCNESQTDLKLPVCSPSSLLGNFFHNQLSESKAPHFMKSEVV